MTSVGLSKFVTESDVEEAKRKRQEEWERVRRPDDPEKAPEPELSDSRPLFTRLEEQRLKKEAEREESRQLKNLVRGLDTDEASFLEQVDDLRAKQERLQQEEERRELEEIKLRTQFARPAPEPEKIEPKKPVEKKKEPKSQAKLLAGAIKRKIPDAKAEAKDAKDPAPSTQTGATATATVSQPDGLACGEPAPKAMRVLGVLSGLGSYDSDSSEEDSDGSSDEEVTTGRDLLGRPVGHQQ